jgi:hypothetical protein
MTTKAPASIIESSAESLEKVVYALTAEIPVQEPNDANRLGYCVWGWVNERRGTLLQAVKAAGTRSKLDAEEITKIVRKKLDEKGIKVS